MDKSTTELLEKIAEMFKPLQTAPEPTREAMNVAYAAPFCPPAVVMYGVQTEPMPGEWRYPNGTMVITTGTTTGSGEASDEMTEAEVLAEVVRLVLEGTLSAKARELLLVILERCEPKE